MLYLFDNSPKTFLTTELEIEDASMLSSVRVMSGVTANYIKSSNRLSLTKDYEKSIHNSLNYLSNKKIIIAEGTGHPGVGSVIGLSNARVANLLNAKILYLVGGGIGRTLDELEVDLSYFSHNQNKVVGVLFNKVIPKKLDSMKSILDENVPIKLDVGPSSVSA